MEKRKRGGQPGNKNALGNSGGGAPLANQNAVKHGLNSRIILTHDEYEYLLESNSEYERQARLTEIKIVRLFNKIGEWEQAKNEDGLIHLRTKRVVNLAERTDYTVTTWISPIDYILKAHSKITSLMCLKYR